VRRHGLAHAEDVAIGEPEVRRQNPYYRPCPAAQRNGLPDQGGVSVEPPAPQTVGQDHYRIVAVLFFTIAEIAPQRGPHSEHAEHVRGHESRVQPLRLSRPSEIHRAGLNHGHRFNRTALLAPRHEVRCVDRQGWIQVCDSRDYLPNRYQPVRLRVRQRLQQDAVDQRKDDRGGTQTQPEHQNRESGESRFH
jgi:hypothetical protein